MDKTRIYEGMFMLDSGNPDFQAATEPVRHILARSEAEILGIRLWDDRRLAYEIKGRKRALYALTYFKVDPAKLSEIEHDCLLEERLLRALILKVEKFSPEMLEAPTPATHVPVRDEERPVVAEEAPIDIIELEDKE